MNQCDTDNCENTTGGGDIVHSNVSPTLGLKVSLSKQWKSCTKVPTSILRRNKKSGDAKKSVSFYSQHHSPITHVNEVNVTFPEVVWADQVIKEYLIQCDKLKVKALDKLVKQIEALDRIQGRVQKLDFRGSRLDYKTCESLECVFMKIQAEWIDLEATMLDEDSCVSICEIIDHYNSAKCLCIGSNTLIGARGWLVLSQILAHSEYIQHLDLNRMVLTEQVVTGLSRALQVSTCLRVIHLENCYLNGSRLKKLLDAISDSVSIEEIYLGDNRISPSDCEAFTSLFRKNYTLELLDLQNNPIQDYGLKCICNGLVEQSTPGLTTLQLWNTGITATGMQYLSVYLCKEMFSQYPCSLRSLNLGRNKIGDEGLLALKSSLIRNRSIQRLGLASSKLSIPGIITMAEILAENRTLLRVDIRENTISFAAVIALSQAMRHNNTILKINFNRDFKIDPAMQGEVIQVLEEIKLKCMANRDRSALIGNMDDIMSLLSVFSNESLAGIAPLGSNNNASTVSSFFMNIFTAPWRLPRMRFFSGNTTKPPHQDTDLVSSSSEIHKTSPDTIHTDTDAISTSFPIILPADENNFDSIPIPQFSARFAPQLSCTLSESNHTDITTAPLSLPFTSNSLPSPPPHTTTTTPPSEHAFRHDYVVSRFQVRKVPHAGHGSHRRCTSDVSDYGKFEDRTRTSSAHSQNQHTTAFSILQPLPLSPSNEMCNLTEPTPESTLTRSSEPTNATDEGVQEELHPTMTALKLLNLSELSDKFLGNSSSDLTNHAREESNANTKTSRIFQLESPPPIHNAYTDSTTPGTETALTQKG